MRGSERPVVRNESGLAIVSALFSNSSPYVDIIE